MAGKTGKGALAWAMYDWADSAFACTIMAAVLPIFYRDGFMGITSKFAAIFGPFIFGAASQATGSSRFGIISLFIFFLAGGLILARVDVQRGRQVALEESLP